MTPKFEAFEAFFGSRQFFVLSGDNPLEDSSASSFSEAVKLESEFVDEEKYILSPNDALIYVSDDREIFLVASSSERLAELIAENFSPRRENLFLPRAHRHNRTQ